MMINIFIFSILSIIAIVVGIVVFNEILLFSFLFVDYSIKSRHNQQEYPPASVGYYVKKFFQEIFYVLGKYYFLPFKFINLSMNTKSKSGTAILFIHGYCRNQTDWLAMRRHFKRTANPIFFVNLNPMFATIQEIARNSLPEKIASIKQQTNCKNIILVAHSMGGLVASYYSEFLDQEKFVKAVITIGTPFYGTRVSVVGKGDNAAQMCPGTEFLTELRTHVHAVSDKYYQICSKFDNLIFPWQSALFEHAPSSRQFILNLESHLGLLHSKEVTKQLKSWLQELA